MLGRDKEFSADFTVDMNTYAATDGRCVIINPDMFFKLTLQEQTFVLAHEILHCIMSHCELIHVFKRDNKVALTDGTSLPYDNNTMNAACDFVINAILVQAKVGKMPEQGCFNLSVATHMDSAIDTYAKLFKQKNKSNKDLIPPGFDEHLAPGKQSGSDPDAAAQKRKDDPEWGCAIAAAVQSGKVMGTLPACIERLLTIMLESKTSWQEHLEAWFARKTGAGSYNWRKPDRIFISRDKPIFVPARQTGNAGAIVVAIDTSGSIGERTLNLFLAELSAIMQDVKPQELVVLWCDAAVHQVDSLSDMSDIESLRARPVKGGGGTDFRPVFDYVDKNNLGPDALIYLTDGFGQFPSAAQDYPVVWGSISRPKDVNYPFGDVVNIS